MSKNIPSFASPLIDLPQGRMANCHRRLPLCVGLVMLVALSGMGRLHQSAHAANATWNGTTNAVWATGTNWSATPVPGTGDTATFNNSGGAVDTIDLGGGVTVNTILFDTASVAAYTIGSGGVGSQTLTINNSGAVTMNATVANNQLFNANISLGTLTNSTYTFTNNSTTHGLTLAGSVQGGPGGNSKTLVITGPGITTISGNLSNGGAAPLVLNVTGGATVISTGNNSGMGGNMVIGGAGNFLTLETMRVIGGGSTSFSGGVLQFAAASTLDLRNDTSTDYNKAWQVANNQDSAATFNVDRPDGGSGTNNVLTMGAVTVGNGRRLIVTGGHGYTARLKGFVTQNGPGTIVPTTTSVAIDTVTNAAGTSTLFLDGTNTGNNTVGAITPSGESVSKSNVSTWKMTGTNVYTGTTALFGGGTLILDYASTDTSKFGDAAVLTLGNSGGATANSNPSGGTLTLNGGTHTELVGSTTISNGGTSITRSGGGTAKLRMNALTRQSGGVIDFADATIADTDTANTNGILGAYATVGGTDWAQSGPIAGDTAVTAYAGYTPGLASGANPTVNYFLTGSGAILSPTTANTLKVANSASSETLTMGTSPLTLGGVLYVGGNDNLYTISGTGAGIIGAGAANEFIVNSKVGTLTISSPIIGSGAGTLTKTGLGSVNLTSASLYTGVTRVHQGILRLSSNTASGTVAGGITVQNGAALELANNISVGTEAIQSLVGTGIANGGALRNIAGNSSTYAGAITVGEGGARINSDIGGTLTLTGGVVTGSLTGTVFGSRYTSTAHVTFGGAGNTTVQTATISGYGKVIKDGTGTLTLTTANTYTGPTTISGGLLLANTPVSGTNSATSTGTVFVQATGILGGTGQITPSSAATQDIHSIANGIAVASGGFIAPGASIGTLTVNLGITSGDIAMLSGSGFQYELGTPNALIGSIAAGSSDLLVILNAVAGDMAFNGNDIDLLGTASGPGFYKLFDTSFNDNTWLGLTTGSATTGGNLITTGLTVSNFGVGFTGDLILADGSAGTSAGDIYLSVMNQVVVSAVPEPSTLALGALGLIGLGLAAWRKRRRS